MSGALVRLGRQCERMITVELQQQQGSQNGLVYSRTRGVRLIREP